MLPTRDHDVVRRWATTHNALPAEITPFLFDSEPAILTFLLGNREGTPEIHLISWESFFAQFDLLGLSFAFDHRSSQFDLVRVEGSSTTFIEH